MYFLTILSQAFYDTKYFMFCLRTYTFLDIAIKSDNVSKWNIFTLGGREIVVASKEVSKRNVQNHGISNKIVIVLVRVESLSYSMCLKWLIRITKKSTIKDDLIVVSRGLTLGLHKPLKQTLLPDITKWDAPHLLLGS